MYNIPEGYTKKDKEDISEQNDLSAKNTGVALRLLEELEAWTADVRAPIPTLLNER